MSQLNDTPHRTLDPRQRKQATVVLAAIAVLMIGLIASVTRPQESLAYDPSTYRPFNGTPLPRQDGTDGEPVVVTVPVPTPVLVSGPPQQILIPVNTQPTMRGIVIEPRPANGPASPEISRIVVDTDHPSARERTRFRWWAGDADGLLRGFVVDFGDGREERDLGPDRCMAQPSDPVQERPPFEHEYENPGTYEVTITVYSAGSCGNGPTQTASRSVTVEVGVFGVGSPLSGG